METSQVGCEELGFQGGEFHRCKAWVRVHVNDITLVFQIPCEDRRLDPQTPPEVRPLGGPFTPSQKVFGGFWKTMVRYRLL